MWTSRGPLLNRALLIALAPVARASTWGADGIEYNLHARDVMSRHGTPSVIVDALSAPLSRTFTFVTYASRCVMDFGNATAPTGRMADHVRDAVTFFCV